MNFDFFSPAQCVGYVAFVLGITAFLQKKDGRLKLFNSFESFSYAVHFFLLLNNPAAISGLVSGFRSLLAIRIRSCKLAVCIIILNLVLGLWFCASPWEMLPVFGSCFATWAALTMKGIPMRLVYFVSTMCWLTNNIISGSIGGTVLEMFIALSNGSTMLRLFLDSLKNRAQMQKSGAA